MTFRHFILSLLTVFCCVSHIPALWIPQRLPNDFDVWTPRELDARLLPRQQSTCGGVAGLVSCGASFPVDFCCSENQQCLGLNTTSATTAALCCPVGVNCQTISPISCDQSLQNATRNPQSGLHVDPPAELSTCGNNCCPPGYSCENDNCYAQPNTTQTSASSASSAATTTSTSSSTTETSVPSSSTPTAGAIQGPEAATNNTSAHSPSASFSGKSFVAGFIPGIILGVLVAGCLVFLCLRRRRSESHAHEKNHSTARDTLTTLGPESGCPPTFHGRSISEPTVEMNMGHRTDFYHFTPPHQTDQTGARTHNAEAVGPVTPVAQAQKSPPKMKGLWSHSPFVNQVTTPVLVQSPVPNHLKRGTLSFHISPVRALRKQRSMHSLRRHLTDATSRSNSSRRQRADPSRTASTETIQVLMQTPDQAPLQPRRHGPSQPNTGRTLRPRSSRSWESSSPTDEVTPIDDTEPVPYNHYPGSSRYPSTVAYSPPQQQVPTPSRQAGGLGTPYTPSRYPAAGASRVTGVAVANDGLRVERAATNRDTTFTAMMERVGLRQSEFMGRNAQGT